MDGISGVSGLVSGSAASSAQQTQLSVAAALQTAVIRAAQVQESAILELLQASSSATSSSTGQQVDTYA